MSQHFILKCPEGHVISQCRCPGPKVEREGKSEDCPECVQVSLSEPTTFKFYMHQSKDSNWGYQDELGLSEKQMETFKWAGMEVEFEAEVQPDGNVFVTSMDGVEFVKKVKIT